MNEKSITIVDAAERLSNRSYTEGEDSKAEWLSIYTCPICGKQVSFTVEEFEQQSFSEETNLSPGDANEIGVASQAYSMKRFKSINFKSFVDFYCKGCQGGVRIYYDAWGGGRYTHGYYAQFIVEKHAA
ncbi:MAG TPA: hypothetical protein VF717_04670 [Pyrinomonadaceae bacterium]|jgi:hypothetical protein